MAEVLEDTQTCIRCGESKYLEDYGRDSSRINGKHAVCKRCLSDRDRERRQTDPEYRRRRIDESRAWQLRNKEEYEARRKAYRDNQIATDLEGWRAKTRRWRENSRQLPPEERREQRIQKKYGISLADYDAILASQNGVCAICGTDEPRGPWDTFAIDHCHESGVVRGLLCSPCNAGIGLLGDTVEGVEAALRYLKGRNNG